MSAPSMAKVASTPRCPLMANCWVKFVAPFTSVIVPAASRSRVLKSRPFRGSELTSWLDRASTPVALAWSFRIVRVISPRPETSMSTGLAPVCKSMDCAYSVLRPPDSMVSRYCPG